MTRFLHTRRVGFNDHARSGWVARNLDAAPEHNDVRALGRGHTP